VIHSLRFLNIYAIIYSVVKSYSRILQEVDAAVQYVRTGSEIPNVVSGDIEFYKSLADAPDDTIVENYVPVLPDFGPSAVSVRSLTEFDLVYTALGVVHGFPVDEHLVDRDICHETAHLDATERLGMRETRYGILVTMSNPPYSYSWRPFHAYAEPTRQVTKLSIASQVAAPSRLSDGDSLRLTAMGYTGRQDVAGRITTSTHPLLSTLRVPR
jgi:hypothetical protein